jgi:Fe-S-cluster containining protein
MWYTHAGVLLNELFDTAKLFPVIFTQKEDDISLQLIYTLKKETPCPYFDKQLSQCTVYLSVRPRACKTYPFNITEVVSHHGRDASSMTTYSVCFDTRCPGLREDQGGIPLISADGKINPPIVHQFIGDDQLKNYKTHLQETRDFLKTVRELDLLAQEKYRIENVNPPLHSMLNADETLSVLKISEKKLSELTVESVMLLHEKKYFNAIYTHLNSLKNIRKLIETRNAYAGPPVDILTFHM